MAKAKCVKVEKKKAEKTRRKLENMDILNRSHEVVRDEENVYFPVKEDVEEYKVVEKETEVKSEKPNSLKEALVNKLDEEEMEELFTSFDIIGDIALVEIPEELSEREEEIGRAIMKVHSNVSTVCKKKDKTQGKYRIRPVEVIAGEEKTETTHKESGVKIKLDLNRMYFNPRLSHEREVIADKVEGKEDIGYLFAGVGPFGLVIAKENPETNIKSVELNPEAYKYLKENIEINNLEEQVEPVNKDVKDLRGYKFDRILMVMPLTSEKYLDSALRNAKEDTVIHYYSIGEEPNYFKKPLEELKDHLDESKFKVMDKREVLSYSPAKKEVVIDIKLI